MSNEAWAIVPDQPEPVRVVMQGKMIGANTYCWAVELASGEIRFYRADRCLEVDREGRPMDGRNG